MKALPLGQELLAELDQVTCSIGHARILGPMSFRIQEGACVGVIGPNGAGKSTLLGLINATSRPSAGAARIFGQDPWQLSEPERCRLRGRVATVLQRTDYNPGIPLLARDVVAMGCLACGGIFGRLSCQQTAEITDVLDRLDIGDLARRAYRSLSGGEQQKVQIARALVQKPELLLLDEPTTGLDIDWQERLVALVDELSTSLRLTILMTTHAIHHLPPCCQRVTLLRDGQILFDGDPASALTSQHIGEVFNCPVELMERNGRRYCLGSDEGC